ncbi:MAG: glucose-6-phosphate dehydrogenase [Acidobacteriia bacterium]|nr:glucose-6-phosphate dehydrogenase [Terriglobia bacterium]
MPPPNPFQDELRFERRVPECATVIFGATGDLNRRKLMPALYRLAYDRRLPAGFSIVGVSRSPLSDDEFRRRMCEAIKEFSEDTEFDADVWREFARGLFYVPGDVNDPDLFQRMKAKLDEIERTRRTGGNVLFYLSVQPSNYAKGAAGIGAAGLAKGNGWRRLVVEKPFGHDLSSARQLSDELHQVFPEDEIYRIDHYLGKETVQNILAFRFGNGIFEPVWNRRYVNHVQITAAESIGVEGRGAYYQEAGALADMIQNHLLQVMATMAMEPSANFHADAVRDERSKLLRAIRPMTPEQVAQNAVAGQYGPARIGGKDVPGFRQEQGVDPQARTDTYTAVALFIDNWRWAGVPFYLRTGKRLSKRVSEISMQFQSPPLAIFDGQASEMTPNLLIIRIQPEEGISLKFVSKRPGRGMKLRPVSMDFNYGSSFGERSPSAYETLLLDALIGDATLYTRQDMVEASWKVVEPIQNVWRESKQDPAIYPAGTWGPKEADEMLGRHGHMWRQP